MSALRQKQPLSMLQILAPEWLLSGYTGHSPPRDRVAAFGQERTSKIRLFIVRFRRNDEAE